MPTAQLTERIADWNRQLQVQSEERLVKNVALTGNMSRNGYAYDDQALSEAVPLYNGKPVFLDHAHNGQRPQLRSTRDLVGSIINPRIEEGRVRGDIRVVDTDSGRTFLALVEANTPGVGMSHVVLAERTTDGKRVKRINDVLSVDVVVNPATTSTFQESTSTPELADAPLDLTTLTEPLGTDAIEEQLAALRTERDQLLTEVNALRASQRKNEIEQLVQESGLPAEAIDASLRTQLEQAPSVSDAKQLLRERQQLVRRLGTLATPHSAPRTHAVPNDAANFISAIKHRS
ncbi:MAG: hypothetical protein KDA66_01180 [Planctomycetaceae bacterium]|nr:hypothetical protein [Planctomycetaceae bacterium]